MAAAPVAMEVAPEIIAGIEGMMSSEAGIAGLAANMAPSLETGLMNPQMEAQVFQGNMTAAQAGQMGSQMADHSMFGLGGSEHTPQSIGLEGFGDARGKQQMLKDWGNPKVNVRGMGEDDKTFMKHGMNSLQPSTGAAGSVQPNNPLIPNQSSTQPGNNTNVAPSGTKPSMWEQAKGFGMQVGSQAVGGLAMAAPMFMMPGMGGANKEAQLQATQLGGVHESLTPGFNPQYPHITSIDDPNQRAKQYAGDLVSGNATQQEINQHAAQWMVNN